MRVLQLLTTSNQTTLDSRVYTTGIDITASDLEKKNRTGLQLMSGCQLLELTKKGTAFYHKAIAFASRKYDQEKMECKESGTTIEDVKT